MIMVIFGAGASYDSVPSRPPGRYPRPSLFDRPPLAAELFLPEGFFANCLSEFPRCKPIVPYLQTLPAGTTLESVLEKLQLEAEADPERKRQITAIRYYLQSMIAQCQTRWHSVAQGTTNYVTLLDQLRRCRGNNLVSLVTFNYDCLIEEALKSVDINISEISDYTQNDKFKLFKLHGSADWAREIDAPVDLAKQDGWALINEIIHSTKNIQVSDRFRLEKNRPLGKTAANIPLFPAIAIPVETKSTFECPKEHLDCLRKNIGQVRKVLIVGWRAAEKHFLSLLRERLTTKIRVQAVAGNKAEAERSLAQLVDAEIVHDGEAMDYGFTEYVISREAERFFQA